MTIVLLVCGSLCWGGGLFLQKKKWSFPISERNMIVMDIVGWGLMTIGLVCLFYAIRALGT
jgi:hypothetical protein